MEFLNVDIGRGHPFYLDGIHEALVRRGAVSLVRSHREVFEECTGFARLGWHAARWLYESASSNGIVRGAYERLRRTTDHSRAGLAHRILGGQLRANFFDSTDPLIVSHPALVGILAGRPNLIYQHGELVTPAESLVGGATLVFVPTDDVSRQFQQAGYSPDQVITTGLCIEPPILKMASDAYSARMARLETTGDLCGVFISSGAEPKDHVDFLAKSAVSVATNGGKAVVIARSGGRLNQLTSESFNGLECSLLVVSIDTDIPAVLPAATIVLYRTRRELDTLVAMLFKQVDYFVAPAHERVNWAVGLGLPMVALEPTTGPFAPLNLNLVIKGGVAVPSTEIGRPESFHWNISRLQREGRLIAMAHAGWGQFAINGFDTIARELASRFGHCEH